MLTHRNLVANMEQIRAVHRIGADDVLIGALPFFHIYGQTVVVNLGLSQGATIVTMPRFDMGEFLDLLERHRVTRAHVAPPVVLGLAKAPGVEGRDLALRVVISGAAPLDADTADRASERLGRAGAPGLRHDRGEPGHALRRRRRARRRRTRARSATWSAAPRAGSSTRRPARTPTARRDLDPRPAGDARLPRRRGGDGRDADRGRLAARPATSRGSSEGEVFRIVDRVKELIKYKGYQVPPAELEALLINHPDVADAAVIPIPDEDGRRGAEGVRRRRRATSSTPTS